MTLSNMRIGRYYSSIRQNLSSLTNDTLNLLDRQKYIGFFKGCGPNYIRGIRRAQEINAIFEFEIFLPKFKHSLKVLELNYREEI